MNAENFTPVGADGSARRRGLAVLRPWLLLLLWAGLGSVLERLAWGWSGSELSTVDRIVDGVLLATVLPGMLVAGWLSIRRACATGESVWLGVLAAFLGPVAAVAIVTAIVHDVDGGFLLVTAVPVSWMVSSVAALVRPHVLPRKPSDDARGSS